METTTNETLDRIQQEIQETLNREQELRRKYNSLNNNEPVNGYSTGPSPEPRPLNGTTKPGSRLFAPNAASTKGVMAKFLRMRGKLNVVTLKPKVEPQSAWNEERNFQPAKIALEGDKSPRNGFVPAEEKMRRELLEFQQREAELRKERRKSQPDLMAALENETAAAVELKKEFRSIEDLTDDSAPGSLKPARSLADLCDVEIEARGTHSLILQFERMNSQP